MTPAPPALDSIKSAVDAATNRLKGTVTESPRLDAEVLMAFTLGWSRARLFAHWDEQLEGDPLARFESYVERRAGGEPVAYIRNLKEFLGLELYVDPRVLIPRPETELLVTRAVAWLQSSFPSGQVQGGSPAGVRGVPGNLPRNGAGGQPLVVDVGTGSGAVAIGIKRLFPEACLVATDVSPDALDVARLNADRHHVRLELRRGSLLEPLTEQADLIVANLPYLSLDEYEGLQGTSIAYEPRIALTDELDGLRLFDQLLRQAPSRLKPGGAMLLEIGSSQPAALQSLASEHLPDRTAAVFADYAGRPRVLQLT